MNEWILEFRMLSASLRKKYNLEGFQHLVYKTKVMDDVG